MRSHDPCLLTHNRLASSWGPMESHKWWQDLAVGGARQLPSPPQAFVFPSVPLPTIKYCKVHLHRV